MRDIYQDVLAFHRKFEGNVADTPTEPAERDYELKRHRAAMLREEVAEFNEACEFGSTLEIAREGCDVIFVVLGTLISLGAPFVRPWKLVWRANMRKAPGPHKYGKLTKPPGWHFEQIPLWLACRCWHPPEARWAQWFLRGLYTVWAIGCLWGLWACLHRSFGL